LKLFRIFNYEFGLFRENLRTFLINSLLFIVLFFLTTPAVVVSGLDTLQLTSRLEKMVRNISAHLALEFLFLTFGPSFAEPSVVTVSADPLAVGHIGPLTRSGCLFR
jgi:hypothetical protein